MADPVSHHASQVSHKGLDSLEAVPAMQNDAWAEPAAIAEEVDDHLALLQGMARGGLLFFSLILGVMLGGLVAGNRGATIGLIVAPLLLIVLWWNWRAQA